MNPDLQLIKTSSLSRAVLIYNSQRSDPASQEELSAATEIFCSKDVAQLGLSLTKSWVSAAGFSAVFAIFIRTSFSREQAKEIKVKGSNGHDFLFVLPRTPKSEAGLR